MNGLTAKSPGIQANEGLFLTACASAEVGWVGSWGVELELWMFLTLSVKDNRKKNKVSAKFKSRPSQILIGNFLATCTILSYFFDSEQLFGELATLKASTF